MLRKIYRTINVRYAAIAANCLLQTVSERKMDDMGVSKSNFVK